MSNRRYLYVFSGFWYWWGQLTVSIQSHGDNNEIVEDGCHVAIQSHGDNNEIVEDGCHVGLQRTDCRTVTARFANPRPIGLAARFACRRFPARLIESYRRRRLEGIQVSWHLVKHRPHWLTQSFQ